MTSPLKSSPEKDYVFECSVCNVGFSDAQELLLHSEKHDMKAPDYSSFSGGVQVKTEPHDDRYSCVECAAEFDTYSELQAHAEVHSEMENRRNSQWNGRSISKSAPTSIMGSVRRQKGLITNSDILERLKKRVFPVSPSKFEDDYDDDDDDDSDKNDIPMISDQTDFIKKSLDALKCEFCGKTFTKRDYIRKHLRVHTGEKPYQCQFCEKRFSCTGARTKHQRIHTGEKPYICNVCGSQFSQSTSLKQHSLKKHGMKRPAYESAGGNSPDKIAAQNAKTYDGTMNSRRSSTRATKTATKYCEPCEMRFTSVAKYEDHLETHEDDFNHSDASDISGVPRDAFVIEGGKRRCTICSQRFSCKSSLKRHYRIHSGERPFKCHVCSQAFTQGSTLKKHLQRIHKSAWNDLQRTKPFESRHFRDDIDFDDMLDDNDDEDLDLPTEPDTDTLRCRYCKVQFANLRYLVTHERTHTARKTHICKHCGRCFGYKSHLKRHMLIHTGEKPYKCRVCKMTFRQKVSLMSHFRISHKGASAFSQTRKKFLNSPSLSQHGEASTNDHQLEFEPYQCEICNKTFQLHSSLSKHMVYHNNGNPLKCTTCGKHFKKQATLKEHMTSHVKAKVVRNSHECSVCGNLYRYSVQLKKHMASHSDEDELDDLSDAECEQEFFTEDTIDDDVANDEVSDDGRHDAYLSEKREGVLLPLDPEVIQMACSNNADNGNVNGLGVSNIPLDGMNDEEYELVSGDESLPHDIGETIGDVDDPSYFPSCKRSVNMRKHYAPVTLGSETLIKLSISMNSGRCTYCGKAFSSRSDMRRHLRTHTGEKPFECEQCGGRFTQKKSLVEHQRTHTGERPHRCDVCRMNFRYRSHLARHMKRNGHFSEVEPLFDDDPSAAIYSCVACNKRFLDVDELRQHLEGVHGIGEDSNIADDATAAEEQPAFTLGGITGPIKLEPLDMDEYQAPTLFESGPDGGLYTCHLCAKDLSNYDSWIKHIDSHTLPDFTA